MCAYILFMNESDSEKESTENASSSDTSDSSDYTPKRKNVLAAKRPCFESASTTEEEESITGASSNTSDGGSSISSSEKGPSRDSEQSSDSEVPHRTRILEHRASISSWVKDQSSDSEGAFIGSIKEDFNYSINRFCNHEPETSTCHIGESVSLNDDSNGFEELSSNVGSPARSRRSSSFRSDEGK